MATFRQMFSDFLDKIKAGEDVAEMLSADEPSSTDVHVDAVMGSKGKKPQAKPGTPASDAPMPPSGNSALDDGADGDEGDIGQKKADEDAEAMAEAMAEVMPPDAGMACGEGRINVADLCARKAGTDKHQAMTLFILGKKFAEPPASINYLPKPGVYSHPEYGTVLVSRERNQRFVDQFNAGIYQKQVPIDLEHQTKLSGAAGWITKLVMNEDGSVNALTDWTDRGRFFLENNRFFYFSPEWYDEWEDPATQKVYSDIAIGGALTTRPFFKDASLKPLVASESGLAIPVQVSNQTRLRALPPGNNQGSEVPMPEMTEAQVKAFAEMEAREKARDAEIAALKSANESQSTVLKAMAEQNTKIVAERRRDRFFGEVRGKSDANGSHWIGDVETHVSMMEHLASLPDGEEGALFKSYVEGQRATAKIAGSSNLFREAGSSAAGGATPNALGRFEAEIKRTMAEQPAIKRSAAIQLVAKAQPELYNEYRDEMNAKRG